MSFSMTSVKTSGYRKKVKVSKKRKTTPKYCSNCRISYYSPRLKCKFCKGWLIRKASIALITSLTLISLVLFALFFVIFIGK